MAFIPVWKDGRVVASAQVDEIDHARLDCVKWYLHAHGYAYRSYGTRKARVTQYLHQAVMNGPAGKGKTWDHINRNPLDCRRSNLRAISRAWNAYGNIQRWGNVSDISPNSDQIKANTRPFVEV